MKAKPDLKMKEFSKQYAREACILRVVDWQSNFSNSKKKSMVDSMRKTLLLASKPPKIAKDRGPGCLAWPGLWSNQGNERMFVFMFEGSGFPKLSVCLYGEWYPLDEGNRWNTFSYAQIYRIVYSNLYGGHRHAWMHLYEWGWSALNDQSFDGSWCVLNWKGSWLGFVVLGSSGVAFAPHAIRHAGLDWIVFWWLLECWWQRSPILVLLVCVCVCVKLFQSHL